ncbi:MAG: hypothetical protein AAF206_22315, partial [Bacteroidota bacterium]
LTLAANRGGTQIDFARFEDRFQTAAFADVALGGVISHPGISVGLRYMNYIVSGSVIELNGYDNFQLYLQYNF